MMKYISFRSSEHATGRTLLNEYWLNNGKVVHQRTTDYGTGEMAAFKRAWL